VKDSGRRVPDVDAKRGLPIRPGIDQPIGPVLGEDRLEHPGRGGRPHKGARGQRCGEDGIVGEQRHQGSHVSGLVRRDQMLDDGPFGLGIRGGSWVCRRREPAVQVRPSVPERAAHRLLTGVEHRRDLLGPETEHVPQDDDGPLTRRQELQGSHERQ